MGFCSDDSNKYLRDMGYNVVRLPSDFLPPLSLLGKQGGTIECVGVLSGLITGAGTAPVITQDQTAANINGKSTSNMDISVGLSILNGLIAGLGGGKLGVSGGYTDARTITFEFNNVVFDSVAPLDVGNYLRGGQVDVANPLLEEYVLGNGSLYAVTERLRASEITVSFETNQGVKANLDVPVIANQVGGKVSVNISGGRTNAVTFKGPKLLTFGFKCFEIGVRQGKITMVSVKPGAVATAIEDEPEAPGALLGGPLLNIKAPRRGMIDAHPGES